MVAELIREELSAWCRHDSVVSSRFSACSIPVIDVFARRLNKPIATFYRYVRDAQIASTCIGVILCAPSQVF